ncbi:hypothetical protein HK102_001413 [Quaeritorhiza haematococci]|nr:hypothetical protein HK102_001413 [Quaeritorhiza haematococci]
MTIPIMLAVGIGASRAMAERMESEAELAVASGGDIDTHNSDAAQRKRMKKRRSASHQLSGLGVVAMASAWPVITVLLLSVLVDLIVPEEEIVRFVDSLPDPVNASNAGTNAHNMWSTLLASCRSTLPLVMYLLFMAKVVLRIDIPTRNSLRELANGAALETVETVNSLEGEISSIADIATNSKTTTSFLHTPGHSPRTRRISTASPRLELGPPSPRQRELGHSRLNTDSRSDLGGWKLVDAGRSPKHPSSVANDLEETTNLRVRTETLASIQESGSPARSLARSEGCPGVFPHVPPKENGKSHQDGGSNATSKIVDGDSEVENGESSIIVTYSASSELWSHEKSPMRTITNQAGNKIHCTEEVQIVVTPASETAHDHVFDLVSVEKDLNGAENSGSDSVVRPTICWSCQCKAVSRRIRKSWFIQEVAQKWFYPVGVLLCTFGLTLFDFGVANGFGPMGNQLGTALPALYLATTSDATGEYLRGPYFSRENGIMLCFVLLFVLGVLTALAEPGLAVLGQAVEFVTNKKSKSWMVILATGIGVGLGLAAGVNKQLAPPYARISWYWIVCSYSAVVIFTFLYAVDMFRITKATWHRLVGICSRRSKKLASPEGTPVENGTPKGGSIPSENSSGTLLSDIPPNALVDPTNIYTCETPQIRDPPTPEDEEDISTENVVAASWDAGVVALGPVITPFVIALASGLAKVTPDSLNLGTPFGALSISSAFPILVMLLLHFGQRISRKISAFVAKRKRNTVQQLGPHMQRKSIDVEYGLQEDVT